ncbi:MAG: NUDIX hydrolase [Flavobacteriaceae bacterium]
MNFDEFSILISKIKNIPLPAEASQFKMVPAFRQDLLKKQKNAVDKAKQAGVMALFYPDKNNLTYLVLILRNTYPGVHSAQIGFPGGRLEATDVSLEAAAVRETFEEVGVPIANIEVVRALTPVYIPPSNFNVSPFLGICKTTPQFKKQDEEVEAVLEISLDQLLSDNNVATEILSTSYSSEVTVPAFKFNAHIVWGATAMMLSEIKDLLKKGYVV